MGIAVEFGVAFFDNKLELNLAPSPRAPQGAGAQDPADCGQSEQHDGGEHTQQEKRLTKGRIGLQRGRAEGMSLPVCTLCQQDSCF